MQKMLYKVIKMRYVFWKQCKYTLVIKKFEFY